MTTKSYAPQFSEARSRPFESPEVRDRRADAELAGDGLPDGGDAPDVSQAASDWPQSVQKRACGAFSRGVARLTE